MPLYSFRCPKCDAPKEVDCCMKDRNKLIPCNCGAIMDREYLPIEHQWGVMEDDVGTKPKTYVDSNGDTRLK